MLKHTKPQLRYYKRQLYNVFVSLMFVTAVCVLGCMQTDATTSNIVAPTMLGVVASMLAVMCKRMQQLPTLLEPTVHRGKDTMCNERVWPQQCWKSCANGSNIVALRLDDHGTKEMLGVEKFDWFQTLRNNMQQGVQTDATCNIQQCWELLANNVASVCTGL